MKLFHGSWFYQIVLPHVFLLLLLMWAASVPLAQINYFSADIQNMIKTDPVALQENLNQIEILIWSAIALTAVIGFAIPWTISRRFLKPILSIRNAIPQIGRGDLENKIQIHAGKELESLADELNGMMEHLKQEQERLFGRNRTLSAISACRHVMIHETDEKQLNQKICQILVDTGAFRIAWIGYADDGAHGNVTQAAMAGYKSENTDAAVPAPLAETAFSPPARAIRNRHAAIISDIFADSQYAPLQADATRQGYASIIALPLSANRQMIGAITLYSEKPDAFGTEEVRIMMELADDLAYGINAIRNSGQ
jgi:nitrate/nitrite-specific signal transduction histidine kinase